MENASVALRASHFKRWLAMSVTLVTADCWGQTDCRTLYVYLLGLFDGNSGVQTANAWYLVLVFLVKRYQSAM